MRIDRTTGAETIVGATGAPSTLFGLAALPFGSTLYASTSSQLGTVDTSTGAFSAVGAFGTAIFGALGPIVLNQVVDLSIDANDSILYGVHRTTLDPDVCYAVADSNDRLVTIDKSAGSESESLVGTTSNGVRAIALVGSTLYAAIGDQLGVIDRSSGVFTARASTFGSANPGPVTIDDARGLTFDPDNFVLYGSHRVAGGDDLLFGADLITGAVIPFLFNAGSDDYATISGGTCAANVDIEDIAFDSVGAVLYGSDGTNLVVIDTDNGTCNVVGAFGGGVSILGMGFDTNGNLFGTDSTSFYSINTGTGAATLALPALGLGTSYGAFDCPVEVPDVLFRVDPASGSYVPFYFNFETTDYALIDQGGNCSSQIESVAVDPEFDEMTGIDGGLDELALIFQEFGICQTPYPSPLGFSDIVDSSYAVSGTLYATGTSTLYTIDTITGAATAFAALSAGTNYEAFECPRPGCKLTLRKRHIGVPYSGSNITYRLFWTNTCDGVTFNNVTITDVLPAGLELIAASSTNAAVSTSGNTVTILDPFLAKGPSKSATIIAKVTAPAGSQITNLATLRDEFGREFVSQDKLRVREPKDVLSVDLHGQRKSRAGKSITYTARYRNLTGSGQLTLTLPTQVAVVHLHPAPTSTAGNVITWNGLGGPSGGVRVRVRVSDSAAETTFVATASLTDGSSTVIDAHETDVAGLPPIPPTPIPNPLLDLNAVRRVLAGTETQITVTYKDVPGPVTISLTLPSQMTVTQTIPTGSVVGNVVTWAQAGPNGSLRLKALVAPGLAGGTLLTINAAMSGSATASTAATIEVRAE